MASRKSPLGIGGSSFSSSVVSVGELSNLARNNQTKRLEQLGGVTGLASILSLEDLALGLDPDTFNFDQRKKEFGKNQLPPPKVNSYISLLYDGLHDTTILMLIAAAVVSLILALKFSPGDSTSWIEGAAILGTVIVVLNVQASSDFRTASAFRQQQMDLENGKQVFIIRGGQMLPMHPRELVVGDVLRVSLGDILAADGVLIQATDIKMDESALTGESKLIDKNLVTSPFLLSGTSIMNGQGRMLVLAVGIHSMQGQILQQILRDSEPQRSEDAAAVAVIVNSENVEDDGESSIIYEPIETPKQLKNNEKNAPSRRRTSQFGYSASRIFGTAATSGSELNSSKRSLLSDLSAVPNAVSLYSHLHIEGMKPHLKRKQGRCYRFWTSLCSLSSGGGSLMEKLDALAINIGKVGLLIAVIVFVVMSVRWAVENYVYGDECNVFDTNQTACVLQADWGCYWGGAPTFCDKQWAGAHDLERLLQFFITSVTILVVAVPEGLPLAVTLSISVSMRRMQRDNNQVKNMQSSETMGSATTICSDKTGTLTQNRMTVMRVAFGDGKFRFEHDFKNNKPVGKVVSDSFIANPGLAQVSLLFAEAVALCSDSTSKVKYDSSVGAFVYAGNATECALLRFAYEIGLPAEISRKNKMYAPTPGSSLDWGIKQYPFSSSRKRLSWIIKHPTIPGGFRLFTKGAPSYILDVCTTVWTLNGAMPIDSKQRLKLFAVNGDYERLAMRGLAVAYRDFPKGEPEEGWDMESTPDNPDAPKRAEMNCTLLGLVGIEDPLRPTVVQAIKSCRTAGVDVRMCTGDSLNSAVAIAAQCGILRPRDLQKDLDSEGLVPKKDYAMTGAEFDERVHRLDLAMPKVLRRGWDSNTLEVGEMMAHPFLLDSSGNKVFRQDKFDRIWPKLRVLARCLPMDKLVFVKGLQSSKLFQDKDACDKLWREDEIRIFPDHQVVAVTGDGTNDAPALKAADVGFAMGIVGTDIAKQACDIIIMDDNFASIVSAVMWGRNVFDSISKFVQFQLTVNITAIFVATVGSFIFDRSPLGAVQMLWVNMIMDTLASLALATEPATPELMTRAPYGKKRPMISKIMLFNIFGQAIFQLVVIFVMLFNCTWLPGYDNMFGGTGGQWVTGNVVQFPFDTSIFLVESDQYTQGSGVSTHWSIVFNTFVLMQLFNEFNSRKLQTIEALKSDWREWNVFIGVQRNPVFLMIVIGTFVLQVVLMQVGGLVFAVVPLEFSQWVFCIGVGAISLPWQWVINGLILFLLKSREVEVIDSGGVDYETAPEVPLAD